MDYSNVKLFNKWDCNVKVNDLGLSRYINLQPKIIPKSSGVHQKRRFHKSKMNIVERLALHLMTSGHSGKKHKISSGQFGGGYETALKIVEKTLDIIEKKENKNPVEVLVRAIENSALREEITSYQVGSVMIRSAVVTSPQRRVDRALRFLSQGSYRKSHASKKKIYECLATEIIQTYKNQDSFAIKEKNRIEQEAASSR